jgi:hypothetical protein
MEPVSWTRSVIAPADILDGIKSIEGKTVLTHSLVPERWVSAETYFGWAATAMDYRDDSRCDSAVSYAKRAVCRRVDGLLLNNWLRHFQVKKYPEKLEMLCSIGIPVRGIVHRLVIGNRNEVEHDYKSASEEEARNALEMAQMMLNCTAFEAGREPVVIAGGGVLLAMAVYSGEPRIESHGVEGLGTDPIIFVDFLETPEQVKLVYPRDQEIRSAELASFKTHEAIAFARHMRTYSQSIVNLRSSWLPKELHPTVKRFQEFKRQTGI